MKVRNKLMGHPDSGRWRAPPGSLGAEWCAQRYIVDLTYPDPDRYRYTYWMDRETILQLRKIVGGLRPWDLYSHSF